MDSQEKRKICVADLNNMITCRLCDGYLIDATALTECFHVFCRGCILRHFENSKTPTCPTCNTVYKKKSQNYFRADSQTQSLVYKLVPSLYARETQRREDFYRSTGVRASSSCSDDSVIDRERDMINDQEEMISNLVGDKTLFLSPDDSVSLSLEYYQSHLDVNKEEEKTAKVLTSPDNPQLVNNNNTNFSADSDKSQKDSIQSNANTICDTINKSSDKEDGKTKKEEAKSKECDKRFLRCPAAVSMKHLQKFIRMKFGLTGDHRVDIIYKGEVLPNDFSLMDVAYSFKWKREKPLRFFYRIFTPTKVRPIKIVNTTLSGGEKQLQIVPVKSIPEISKPAKEETIHSVENVEKEKIIEETEDQKQDKEILFAHLQLQSKSQTEKDAKKLTDKKNESVFDYEEPDEEEIKKFAEKRDREWALQKKMDETKSKIEGYVHMSKKRKKNKHSKNEFNVHKKRKLHAEIASNEEDLKLKVKITNNGYKHKHHKSSGQLSEKTHSSDTSTKEKLLQMRQVRHKHVSGEDKNIQTVPSIKLSKDATSPTEKIKITLTNETVQCQKSSEVPTKLPGDIRKLKIKVTEPSSKVTESAVLPKQQTETCSTSPKMGTFLEPSTSSTDLFSVSNSGKEISKKVPPMHLERNDVGEKQAQNTFLKPFTAFPDKLQGNNEKIQQNKKIKQMNLLVNNNKPQMKIATDIKAIEASSRTLERQIATLKQNCSIKASQPEKIEKKVTINKDKPKMITPHYPPGFTVSKVEQGVKRKLDNSENNQDKRPSLEITLISSPASNSVQTIPNKPAVKRPPPATIPLEKIKKINLKSGISIIPKRPEKCDNIGALDLSRPGKLPDSSQKIRSGFTITSRPNEKTNMGLSNLQMLSKVATEHSSLNSKPPQMISLAMNKPRPQIPNLQTLSGNMKSTNMQKLPKLNELPSMKFRPTNAQIRNMRPNQNQNIRNIPNPSLLNQNRNSLISAQTSGSVESCVPKPIVSVSSSANATMSTTKEPVTTISAVNNVLESKVQEKAEISV